MKPASSRYRRWLVLIGSISFQLSLGTMFAFGNASPYIASYLAATNSLSVDLLPDGLYGYYLCQCNWIFATCYIVFTLSALLGAHIQQQIGVKSALTLSSLLMVSSLFMCYFTLSNLYSLIFCFLLFGCGAGIAYPVPFVSCLEWFKIDRHQTGDKNINNNYHLIVLLHSCFTCSPLLFAPLQFAIVNPRNIDMDSDFGFIADHEMLQFVPMMFVYLAAIVAVLQIIGILFINNPSLDNKPMVMRHSHSFTGRINEAIPPHSCSCRVAPPRYIGYHSIFAVKHKEDRIKYQMPRIEIILNRQFWTLWMIHLCSMTVFFFMILFVKTFAVQYLSILNDHYLTTILSIAFAINLVSRLLWNKVFGSMTSIGNKKLVLFLINAILCIFIASLSVTHFQPDLLYAVWIIIIFGVMGCDWICYPSLIAVTFGGNYSGHVMAYCHLADIPALLMVVVVANHLYSMDNTQSWEGFTWIIASCLVFSSILSVVFDPHKVIAEREDKDTIKRTQFPSYHSYDSVQSEASTVKNGQKKKVSCGCGADCTCACRT